MFKIFLFENYNEGRAESRELIKKCASLYDGCAETADFDVEYDDRGKPEFTNSYLKFSISHSGDVWAAVMGKEKCGLDVQEIRECQFERLAHRFFSDEECIYVQKQGIEAYFSLWSRREALGKFTGEGFFMKNRPALVNEQGVLYNKVEINQETVYFHEVFLGSGYDAVWCSCCEDDRAEIVRAE